jgi:hypothetical protein
MVNQELELYNLTIMSIEAKDQIAIKPVCEFFDISLQNQHRRMKKDLNFKKLWTKKSTDFGFLNQNGQVLLTKKGFIRWVQDINANIVRDDLIETLSTFQSMVFDFLFNSNIEKEKFFEIYAEIVSMKNAQKELSAKIKEKTEIIGSFKFVKEFKLIPPKDLFSELE